MMAGGSWERTPFHESFPVRRPSDSAGPGGVGEEPVKEPRWLRWGFPKNGKARFFWAVVATAGLVLWVLRRMLQCEYAPGVGWRMLASTGALVAISWAFAWVVIRKRPTRAMAFALVGLLVTVPTFLWSAMVWTTPLAGPVGRREAPAYLEEPFEIAVREQYTGGEYATVSGTVTAVQEVAVESAPPTGAFDGDNDWANPGRCWAVEVELVSRLDPWMLPPHDQQYFRVDPQVGIETPDGNRASGTFYDGTSWCDQFNTGLAVDYNYAHATEAMDLTVYHFTVVLGLPTRDEPSLVEVTVNNSTQASFYVPYVAPESCRFDQLCDGPVTLDDRVRLNEMLMDAVEYAEWQAENCTGRVNASQACHF